MPADYENIPLPEDLRLTISRLRELTGNSSDLLISRLTVGGADCALLCCEGMVSSSYIAEEIAEPLSQISGVESSAALLDHIRKYLLLSTDSPTADTFGQLFRLVYSGFALLLANGSSQALAFGAQGYASRGVQEPANESNIMGAHEGFSEVIRTNMSQVRRRLKTPELCMEMLQKGSQSRTDLCLCYMKDRVPPELLSRIRSSLDQIKLEALLTTGHIRPFLEQRSFHLFSTAGTTERPDVLCSKLIEGRVAIFCDGLPFAVVVPKLFCESFQTLDDYAFKPLYAGFIRWLKYLSFLVAVLLPGVYAAVVMYHPELLNSTLLMLLVKAEKEAPLSIITESLLVLLMYEAIREAGVRLPKPAGGAISVISGLMIGDAAVKSGLVSTPLLTMTALSVLGGMSVPELDPQITLLRFGSLAAGGFLGLFGVSLLCCVILADICSGESYGFPYFAPLSPFKRAGMSDTLYRTGVRKMQSRGFTVEDYHE